VGLGRFSELDQHLRNFSVTTSNAEEQRDVQPRLGYVTDPRLARSLRLTVDTLVTMDGTKDIYDDIL